VTFRGTYEHTLDVKGRLTVPSKFRSALADGVVLAKGVERCIAIWTPDAYELYTANALDGLNPLSPKARELSRFFAANSFDSELDGAGRVMLPPVLAQHANLTKELVVTGAGRCLEIWDRQVWSDYNANLVTRVMDIAANFDAAND
jgi:MraZ protein